MALRRRMAQAVGWMAAITLPASLSAQTVTPSMTQTSSLTLMQDQPLHFGSFAVLDHGSKSVGALGAVIDEGLVPLGSTHENPAQFTLTWQRGDNSVQPVTVVVQLTFGKPPPAIAGSVTAQITAYETDLGGLFTIPPGGGLSYTFATCTSRTCSATFRVGARIDVTASGDGAPLTLALPITARIVAEY